jgi:two-component SAPR family response regulator
VWEEFSDGPDNFIGFYYHNRFYSEADSVLHVFGGYGQHQYFNLVQQYTFKSRRWDTIEPGGSVFHPRMHAALGIQKDTVFILGGFGSKGGNQILNPEHYTDLLAYSLRGETFHEKFNFQAPLAEIDFAHSMIIDESDRSFYVLASTIFEYDTYLQLLKGNLDDPWMVSLGDQIPYKFHNEYSFSDLFYSSSSQELIAISTLADSEKQETDIRVHKLSYPPHNSVVERDKEKALARKILPYALMSSVFFLALIFLINRRKKQNAPVPDKRNEAVTAQDTQNDVPPLRSTKPANSILFFGGFQVINRNGDEITKKFTPLLKELFLLIFLYSIKDKGISVPRLTEILWFSMDPKTAKNNRAVNIAKLKHLISELESFTLSRSTGYWQVEFNDSLVYNDYWSCMKKLMQEEALPEEELHKFLCIINKGSLLGNASYEWLDEFKLDCSNRIIDKLSSYLSPDHLDTDPELVSQVADAVLIFDTMHEEAVSAKCKALTALGKHSLAKEIYEKFAKEYKTLYDESFDRSFTDLIKN